MPTLPPDLEVENVLLYVADAVRWDYTPDRIINKGLCAKSIAASIHSPSSFASILSGMHLPQHQVGQFQDTLPSECFNLVTSLDMRANFANTINHKIGAADGGDDIISNTLNIPLTHPDNFEELEPPFIFVERGKGGHSPYGPYDGDSWDYYQDRGAMNSSQYAEEYREGVENDADWFQTRLEILADRGLLEDTLVIYTSDHGELLGERGMLAHSPPIHRRHVEVPTVFIHPEIDKEFRRDRVVRHVDLVPTILSVLNADVRLTQFPGRNLQEELPAKIATSLFNQSQTIYGDTGVSLRYNSVWDSKGGYVFPRSNRMTRLAVGLKRFVSAPWRRFFISHATRNLPNLLQGPHRYGTPQMSIEESKERVQEITQLDAFKGSETVAVPEEKLKNLGYMQ